MRKIIDIGDAYASLTHELAILPRQPRDYWRFRLLHIGGCKLPRGDKAFANRLTRYDAPNYKLISAEKLVLPSSELVVSGRA